MIAAATMNGTALAHTADAAPNHWPLVVIGAGPAGSAAAIGLARRGQRVLLIDRDAMPRPKLCGCCLSPRALDQLVALGVLDGAGRLDDGTRAVPLDHVRLAAAGRSATIPMPGNACLSREALDAALVRTAVAAGVRWLPGCAVTSITPRGASDGRSPDGAVVEGVFNTPAARVGSRLRITADRVVIANGIADTVRIHAEASASTHGAPGGMQGQACRESRDGRRASPHSRIGLGTVLAADALAVAALPCGVLVMAVASGGYCGMVRLEDGRIDLAAAVDRRLPSHAGSPAAAVASILREALGDDPVARPPLEGAAFRATPPLTHHAPPVADARATILRVGDAAGYVEPFTGEGIGWALVAAGCLARAAASGTGGAAAGERYRADVGRLLAADQRRCLRVARALRHPAVVAGGVRLAGLLPWAARVAVPLVLGVGRRARAAAVETRAP